MNEISNLWRKSVLPIDASVKEVIQKLQDTSLKIVLILDLKNRFLGTITDGDVRRGLLRGIDINSKIDNLINKNPFVVPANVKKDTVLNLMQMNKIQQIPILDDRGDLIGLHVWDELVDPVERSNLFIIMAGGRGTRLKPFTDNCPKPMLRVHDKPILEHIIYRAKNYGYRNFLISINYLGDLIEKYFGDGSQLGVSIKYLREAKHLGTAGSLSLIRSQNEKDIIVINGDSITDIDFNQMLNFHNEHKAAVTMAVRTHEWQNPYGVVKTQGVDIKEILEKPLNRSLINAGCYVLQPSVLKKLEQNVYIDMTTLINKLVQTGVKSVAFPIHESWIDIGTPEDLVGINRIKTEG